MENNVNDAKEESNDDNTSFEVTGAASTTDPIPVN